MKNSEIARLVMRHRVYQALCDHDAARLHSLLQEWVWIAEAERILSRYRLHDPG